MRATTVGLLATATLIVAAIPFVPFATASAAPTPGQVVVSGTPTPLVQPPDPFLGAMAPAADADTQGMFAPQVAWPLMPIHAALAPSGRLVTYGSPVGQAVQGGLAYDDWSPGKGTSAAAHVQTASMDDYNSFCNGLQQMPDGRFLMVGGNSTMSTMFYDPVTKAETMGPGLNRQRWYATVLRRPDDRVVVIGGGNYYAFAAWQRPADNSVVATVPEIGTGSGPWSVLTGADSTAFFGAERNRWWYPRAYNAPDGSVFGMSDDRMWRMTTTGTGSVTDLGRLPIAPGVSGSSVMYDTGRILVAGGGQNANDDGVTAIRGAVTVDINAPTPRVATTQAMALPRNWLNLTVLANGEVLANGGTVVGTQGPAANSSYRTEIWNPGTGTWRSTASATRIRTYHSTAALMPSGSVFTGGGGAPGPEDNLNAEMYYPPYLFTRRADGTVGWADRPAITSIAGNLVHGGRLTLGLLDARRIASASLIRVANVTHSINVDQRRIPLTIAQDGTSLTATLPASRDVLPPGSYLLQGVDDRGVPTPGQLVTLQASGAPGTVAIYDDSGTPPATPPAAGPSVDDANASVVYTGNWARATGEAGPFAGTNTYSDAAGATATLTFVGTGVTLRGVTAPNHGIVAVSVDGAPETLVDEYSATRVGDAIVWSSPRLTSGRHMVRVRVTGTQRPAATYRWASIDRFEIADQPVSGTPYRIVNRNSGKPLTVAGGSSADGAPVVQQAGTASWTIRSVTGVDGAYTLTHGAGGKALDVNAGSTTAGLQLQQWTPNGGTNQHWFLRPAADGYYTLVSRVSGQVADVWQQSTADGARVVQWPANGGANQLWQLVPM